LKMQLFIGSSHVQEGPNISLPPLQLAPSPCCIFVLLYVKDVFSHTAIIWSQVYVLHIKSKSCVHI